MPTSSPSAPRASTASSAAPERSRPHHSKPSLKGEGLPATAAAHEHWHVDVTYINVAGTFFYLCSLLDGYSRFIVHWEIRESMTESEVETIIQRARERFPGERPRIISDNGPQFIAKDFKEFIRICGMTHVRTSLYYPQSNGKMETVVQDPQGGMHPGQDAVSAGRCPADHRGVRGALQRRSACTARSATSHRPTNWPAATGRSSPSGTANWMRPASGGKAARAASRAGAAADPRRAHCPAHGSGLRMSDGPGGG